MKLKILVVEDEPEMLQFLARFLSRKGYTVITAACGEQGWKAIEETVFDLVISDMAMDDLSGIELLERVRTSDATLPFIIMTGVGTIESAVEAIKMGAFHYISKPFRLQDMEILVQRALESGRLHRELRSLKLQEKSSGETEMVVGASKCMQELMRRVEKISASEASVLIQGETGTGKSLLAKMIHEKSARCGQPFLTIDCGALTDTLLESELFGHVKGAFTGALSAKRGLLEEAQGGTVFLDEIAEIRLPTQVKLLRAIQEKEIKPVGGNLPTQVDVRFISATSRELMVEIEKGRFREELYYRLAVVPLHLPALRDRQEDIPMFLDHFVKKFCKAYKKKITQIDPKVLQMVYSSAWKGNIRELGNIIERAVILSEKEAITFDCLCADPVGHMGQNGANGRGMLPLRKVVEDAEKEAIVQTLKAVNNNRTQAAHLLGISRRALYDKLEAYGVGGSK